MCFFRKDYMLRVRINICLTGVKQMRKLWALLLLGCLGAVILVLTYYFGYFDKKELYIHNSRGERIYVELNGLQNAGNKKLVFMQHGLGTSKETPIIDIAEDVFVKNGYVVISFDSRYANGRSEGRMENARLSTYAEDLDTVAGWAEKTKFYTEPFVLLGHSLGGASAAIYAEKHPERVSRVVLLSPFLGGKYFEEAQSKYNKDAFNRWKKNGYYVLSNGEKEEKISYSLVREAESYDAVKAAANLKSEVFLLAADGDNISPPEYNQKFFDHLNTSKQFYILQNSNHIYSKAGNMKNFEKWLEHAAEK